MAAALDEGCLAATVHELEQQPLIELTRRGEPVAVLLSTAAYRQLVQPVGSFWSAYEDFRAGLAADDLAAIGAVFDDLRDGSPGRDIVTFNSADFAGCNGLLIEDWRS